MLADVIMWMFITMMIIVTGFGGAELGTMIYKEGTVQQEAQLVARYEGQFGGYDINAEQSVEQFASRENLSRDQVTVSASAPGSPVAYGTEVTASVTMPFNFSIGTWMPSFTVNLSGSGRSVSVYTPGVTPDTTYLTPS